MTSPATADLCDAHPGRLRIVAPLLRDFGGAARFHGPVATVQVFEDNVLVRALLETPGEGRVLVVDGGGSERCALLGDRLAGLACEQGWSGVVVHGCIRDAAQLAKLPLGVRALGTHPCKSAKNGRGERNLPVHFAGVSFRPGDWLYADQDGIVVSDGDLLGKLAAGG